MFSNLGNNLNPGITEEAFEDFFYCLLSKEDNRGPQEICRSTQNKPRYGGEYYYIIMKCYMITAMT